MIPVIFLCIVSFLAGACSTYDSQVENHEYPNQIIENFEINNTVKGKVVWNLAAKKAEVFDQQRIAMAEKPLVKFYEEGSLASTMKSGFAQLFTDTNNIDAWDHVIIQSKKDNSQLEAEKIHYDATEKKIYSDDKVTLRQENAVTVGSGMESNVDLSSIIIQNQIVEINTDAAP